MLVLHRPLRLGPAGVDRTSVELSHLVVAISRNTLVSPFPSLCLRMVKLPDRASRAPSLRRMENTEYVALRDPCVRKVALQ